MLIKASSLSTLYNVIQADITNYELDRVHLVTGDTRWRSWLRHCTTSRKVAGLILDGVTGIFH
jgi:hypothetical protein